MCKSFASGAQNKPATQVAGRKMLLHQKHLARTLNRAVQPPLIVSGQASVFPRKNPALISYKLPKQVGVFEVQGIYREIDFRLRARSANFSKRTAAARAPLFWFFRSSFARHRLFDFAMERVAT